MKGGHFVTHGLSKMPEYRKWAAMKSRCVDPRERHHHGKGVRVCPEWSEFPRFLADVGPMPSRHHTIDRYPDPAGNYEPGNVRWATAREQANNRSSNRIVEYAGRQMSLSDAVSAAGNVVSRRLAWHRLSYGWSTKEALETPPRKGNYRRRPRG